MIIIYERDIKDDTMYLKYTFFIPEHSKYNAFVISYEYVYVSEGRYDSFYCLTLYNLVLGLTTILIKSKLFK